MSSRTSSRSPLTMTPSLKYLIVSSMAARKASSSPMSLTATLGVVVPEIGVASMLAVMKEWLRGWTGVGCGQVSAGRADGPVSTCRDPGPLMTCGHEGGEDRLTERGLL